MILVRYSGDITTKARRTRIHFTRRLVDNLRDAFRAEGIEARVQGEWNRTYIRSDHPGAADVARRVFGVHSISVGENRRWSTLDDVVEAGAEIFRPLIRGRRFAVRANRCGKSLKIPFRSRDVEVALGAALLPDAARVDLTNPEVTAHVEVNPGDVVFFPERARGHGGIPIGVQGRALALVSGGFDSAVAAWMLLRRGLALDYLFLNLGGAAHEEAVLRVMKVVTDRWSYGYRPKLHSVDLRPFVEEMQAAIEERYLQVVLKRVMLRVGEKIARRARHVALITGEAVGQVSSQTLQNLAVINGAVDRLILRPLVGFNKEEILDRARLIGTFDLSAGVPEFCALTPSRPATRATREAVEAEEAKLDFERLEAAVSEAARLDLRRLDLSAAERADLTIDEVPENAEVLDLRPLYLYRQGHYPDALHLDYGTALKSYPSFDRSRTYVLYCEVGFKSAFVADEMRQAGLDAFHVRGGLKTLMKKRDPAATRARKSES